MTWNWSFGTFLELVSFKAIKWAQIKGQTWRWSLMNLSSNEQLDSGCVRIGCTFFVAEILLQAKRFQSRSKSASFNKLIMNVSLCISKSDEVKCSKILSTSFKSISTLSLVELTLKFPFIWLVDNGSLRLAEGASWTVKPWLISDWSVLGSILISVNSILFVNGWLGWPIGWRFVSAKMFEEDTLNFDFEFRWFWLLEFTFKFGVEWWLKFILLFANKKRKSYLCRVESKLNSFLIERLWNDWSVKFRSLSVPISSDLSNVLSPQISFGDMVVSIGDTDVPGDVTQDWIESGDCTSEYADSGDRESSLIPVKS